MADAEENSSLFPIFILTLMALPLVPYAIVRLLRAFSRKAQSIHCQCSACSRSGKYRKSIFKRISNFSTCSNLTLVLLWIIMGIMVYYIKHISHESQPFEPFSILGLETGASDSEIKKAYRRLSIIYHPDKNPDPEAHKYFVEYISKSYQALTDPIARENFEKYGHPDGRQGLQMGIALPQFLLNFDGATGGVLLLGIVGVCILFPLMIAVIYLSKSSKYTGNYVMHQTLSTYYYFMKPSLAPSKVMDVFIKAAEYMEMPVRRSEDEPLQKLFVAVRSELNLDLKNIKTEQAKFWKQHPSLVKTELLILTHLTRESALLSPVLQSDFKRMLELASRLLEELLKMAVIPRSPQGHGWLRPAVGVVELSQCIIQAVPLSARKVTGENSEGIASFLQLPHFSETAVKKIGRKIGSVIEKTITQVHFIGEGNIGAAAISESHRWIYSGNFVEGTSEWHQYFLAGIKTIAIISLPSIGVVQFGSTNKISESLEFINQVRHLFCQQENMTGYFLPGNINKTQGVYDPCASLASLIYSGHTHASPKSIDLFHDAIAKELQNNAEPSTGSFQYASYSPGASISVSNPLMKIPSTNSISSFRFTSRIPASGSPTPGFSLSNNMQLSYTFPSSPFATNLNKNSRAKETSTLSLPEQRPLPENPFHYFCTDSISLSSSKSSSIASELPDTFLSFPQDSSPENSGLYQCKDDQTNDQTDLCDQPPLSTKNNITSVENVAISYSPSTDLPSEPADISVMTACDWKECSSNGHAQFPLDNDLFEGMELDLSPRTLRQECWDDIVMPLGTDGRLNLSPGVSDCMPSFDQLLESLVGDCTNLSSSTTHSSIPTSLNSGHQVSTISRVDSYGGNTKLAPLPEFSLGKIIQESSKEALPKLHASSNINAESPVTYKTKKPEENAKVRKRARPGESTRPRPKDRQQIQDRVKELREIVPNGAKCSIDSLLNRTIKHMLFLQSVAKYADRLKQTDEPKMLGNEGGVILKDNPGNNAHSGGATWAYEVAGQTMVCPILVEDLNPPGQMLVEMLCEERGFFLEIADVIRGFGLAILKGVMEIRERKIWARFLVEATRDVTRLDIFLSLVQLLQQTSSLRTNGQQCEALDKEVPDTFSNSQPTRLSTPIRLQ